MATLFFVTHPEVVIDPAIPVPDWPLSARGAARMRAFAARPTLGGVRAVWSSAERKARDAAAILGDALGLAPRIDDGLGENDRSATGFLPPERFWPVVARFFAEPRTSVLGWERAVDAQARALSALGRVEAGSPPGDVVVAAHGGVGALTLAHFSGAPISGAFGQPVGGGGCVYAIERGTGRLLHGWRAIED